MSEVKGLPVMGRDAENKARFLKSKPDGVQVIEEESAADIKTASEAIAAKDFATQTTLSSMATKIDELYDKINAVEDNDTLKVTQSGTFVQSSPVTGVKTVTATAASLFAGGSVKSGRNRMLIRNMHEAVSIRLGGATVTDTTGYSLEPGAEVFIEFDQSITTDIYAVSAAGNVPVEVLEA